MNTYKLNVKVAGENNHGLGSVRVQAADKASAPAEAIKAMVRHAKEFNAKYDGQIAGWQHRSENPADYEVWGTIRKMPAKVAA
jgi:hypothetical protein